MSANITSMKFSVFGRGYEDERVDSGEGIEGEMDRHFLLNGGAVIDSTSTYLWIVKAGDVNNRLILKYDLATFTDVGQTIITAKESYGIYHPTNVANNLGIVLGLDSKSFYVFDLTDDTVYASGTFTGSYPQGCYDSILVDDKIYIIDLKAGRTNTILFTIDLTNQTASGSIIITGRTSNCFVDDSHIYGNYPPEWFTQYKSLYLSDLAGNTAWSETATAGGGGGFPNIETNGLGGNGKIYLPTKIYGAWRMGEYNADTAPDVVTPKPKRVFGKFKSQIGFDTSIGRRGIAYNDGRTRMAFTTNLGVFVTDLEEVELLTDELITVYCMNDEWVIGANSTYQYLYTFKYR